MEVLVALGTAAALLIAAFQLSHAGYVISSVVAVVVFIVVLIVSTRGLVSSRAAWWTISVTYGLLLAVWLVTWTQTAPTGDESDEGAGPGHSQDILADWPELAPYIGLPTRSVAEFSEWGRIGPLRLSMPKERMAEILGASPDEEWTGPEGETTARWEVTSAGMAFNATFDPDGTAERVRVSPLDENSLFGLQDGLILGATTFGEVYDTLGQPTAGITYVIEAHSFYEVLYQGGPEGSWWISFNYNALMGSAEDPGVDNLSSIPVGSFAIMYGNQLPCEPTTLAGAGGEFLATNFSECFPPD